ncbi:hypothetical protein BDN72DRAFT_781342 [Pluteus cervinus]|uniref:Uncharacterized protein n=1 Tax=Pluteus cervinus TaxID=181527 RepID=A0ACD3A107_9AGAR|nr:hypothetical protein BDN72DRAFT_781342 [Pluteus cervinus]
MTFIHSGMNCGSEAALDRLVHNVILHKGFKLEDLKGFSARRENARLAEAAQVSEIAAQLEFKEVKVEIDVPSGSQSVPSQKFPIPGLLYRKLTSVLKTAFADPLAHHYHYSPFTLNHSPSDPSGLEQRVWSEVFNSDAFISENDKVQLHAPTPPDEPRCTREKVVAAVMFASDSTLLANFGAAKAWPIYFMLGNLSKYIRAQPGSGALHHVAYIPSLPDSFQDWASKFHHKWNTQQKGILAHCRRELMQATWELLLDDDFLHAYTYGMVITCIDGVERRVYPRIFTYSADYPEKVLLATIRDKGLCPCPRCLVSKAKTDQLGTRRDTATRMNQLRTYLADKVSRARKAIYQLANPITGKAVEDDLKATSAVPTFNAFVRRLGDNFDPFGILVVDLLHEFEIGVWKTLFTHLIRLLYAAAPHEQLVVNLNERYVCFLSTNSIILNSYQVSANLNLWSWDNSPFFNELGRNEKESCPRF